MMKVLKTIVKAYGIFLVVYWSIAGIMSLGSAGWNWGYNGFDNRVLKAELKRRFLP